MKFTLRVSLLVAALGLICALFPVQAQQAGGAFIPSFNYDISGLWNFSGGAPTVTGGGSMVSTTATQTLTNKTLSAPEVTYPFTTITGDGAVSISSGVTLLTKGSAAAITLAAPGAAGIGKVLTITTGSDFAHVVTFTGGTLWDGTAGANTTWTAAAVQGSSITVVGTTAVKWNVVSYNLGTIAP